MKDTEGLQLRETWQRKGKPECLHSERSRERSFSGVVTGAYICTTCGHLMAMECVPHEVQPMGIALLLGNGTMQRQEARGSDSRISNGIE